MQVDGGEFTSLVSQYGDPSARSDVSEHPTGHRTAHGVDRRITPRQLASDLAQLVHPHDLVDQRGRHGHGLTDPRQPNYLGRTSRSSHRGAQATDQSGDPGDHDCLPFQYAGNSSYGSVGRESGRQERESGCTIHCGRQTMYGGIRHDGVPAPEARPGHTDSFAADDHRRPGLENRRSDHDADALGSWDEGLRGLLAGDHRPVGLSDRGQLHLDQRLIRSGDQFELFGLHLLPWPMTPQHDPRTRTHRSLPRSSTFDI